MGAVHNMYQNQQNNVILIKYFFFHHISTRAKFLVLSFYNKYPVYLPLYQEKTRVYIIYMFRPVERTSSHQNIQHPSQKKMDVKNSF